MNKKNILLFSILIILLIISTYFNFKEQPIFQKDSTSNSAISKVANLYNQMLPSLPPHDLYCIPIKKFYCSLEGCKDVEPNVFTLLGKNIKEESLFIARCDNKPCDVYEVNLLQSGPFITFETKEPHGMLFRTSTLDQSFIEVVTLGTDSFVSNGYCYSK